MILMPSHYAYMALLWAKVGKWGEALARASNVQGSDESPHVSFPGLASQRSEEVAPSATGVIVDYSRMCSPVIPEEGAASNHW